ncbi:hypothetical protein ABID82_006510 [Methylobacterium sp. PvP062]|jgi:hypothetical protein|uniref:Uncharacterized protein n=1 Tax=Methylobacterium radiotolerans TaxID=31998 RepID=A0ABV2NSZ6_9HYPH|nr:MULTISPECIES: hypothetical protein [Methylobacterium]MBE7196990.1 hypothetical protein [Parafilimonas terrae]MCX7336450.1 hypothetical protein [Hyphomicrobiales bacterium]GAN51157.1 hypothetical protein ME121_5224 [Methylobacterium sp. ME121]KIU27866.1 hypothetical protein SR39_27205 [Methylobacterium radiotolerans]MBN6823891.1 hypothetical protein [Methylobacterium organophilum]
MPLTHPFVAQAIVAETEAMKAAILAEKMRAMEATGAARAFAEMAAAQRARAAWARAQIAPRRSA